MRGSSFPIACSLSLKARNFTGVVLKELPQSLPASQLTSRIETNRKDLTANREQVRVRSHGRPNGNKWLKSNNPLR